MGLLGAISFMVIADMRVVDPLLRIIANEFGTTVGNTAAIISAYTIPYGLFQLVYSQNSSKYQSHLLNHIKVWCLSLSVDQQNGQPRNM